MFQPDLPKGVFNTVQAKRFMGVNKKMTIRGTVVDARKTGKGHLFFKDQSGESNFKNYNKWIRVEKMES